MTLTVPTRRDRVRARALREIREHAYAQIAAGGPTALSLNGIAKAMGMSGPAMYRYFTARDELLATLVTESYEGLADALDEAAEVTRRRSPESRLRAVLDAARQWAIAQPHRYRLVFGSTYGSGRLDPDRIVPASHRSMSTLLHAMRDLQSPDARLPEVDTSLRRQLIAWNADRGDDVELDPGLLALGIATWTRANGVISLEIEGAFDQMGLDPARIYRQEVGEIVARLRGQ